MHIINCVIKDAWEQHTNLFISNTIRAHVVSLCAAYCANLWSHAVFCLKDMVRDNMFDKNSRHRR